MSTREPQKRYIGDGVYVGHDGYEITLETSDGIQVTNRICLESNTLEGLKRYLEYANKFYEQDQHRVGPGCEGCGKNITKPNPIEGTIQGEVYHIQEEDVDHEIRLCYSCASSADHPFLISMIQKRSSETEEANSP